MGKLEGPSSQWVDAQLYQEWSGLGEDNWHMRKPQMDDTLRFMHYEL